MTRRRKYETTERIHITIDGGLNDRMLLRIGQLDLSKTDYLQKLIALDIKKEVLKII